MKQIQTDVLIVGSGPIGATYARLIKDALPDTKILMIEKGPRLTGKAGMHVKNIEDDQERERAQILSQGPHQKPYPLITVTERANAVNMGELSIDLLGRPGTHLVSENAEDLKANEMPAASCSTNVGGMAAHWTCACPRPGNAERIPFIPDVEMDQALTKAEKLLCVTQSAFPESAEGLAIQKVLGDIFNEQLTSGRKVQPMPLACITNEKGERYWVGPDVILGDLAEPGYAGNFELRDQTICRQLYKEDGHVTGALIEHLPSGTREEVKAKLVIVACDALRTPQLLWASGIRPKALGHYLNEHPFIFCFVELKDDLVDTTLGKRYDQSSRTEPTIGVFLVPFDDPGHPFHAQIMHMDVSPLKIETHGNPKHVVGLGIGCLKEMRYEDCIEFSETEQDYSGMPKMSFQFQLTEKDRAQIASAKVEQVKAAAAFGKVIQEGEQTLMPAGTSLHAQATVRMGVADDGTSVCDTFSNVWGYDNLFVGGNGVLPVPTTCNPTLTSVALAVRSSEKVISLLKHNSSYEQRNTFRGKPEIA
ncbi:GMC oxidoreductase [Chitinophagaceae bacterium LB-8]|uniref:GMC oxidoreductase n=1 Tax=Paraflavisolibacter caeni TaxID=2982496 RepID=A0A9X2XUX6_9BACT|nr:GMC oxidoreductase [Paraflavisolibacter caeni]MCU7549754.1 GMC oxidoreductase [Paraflavisolibacter caeni]